jgi:hypothetical protein
MTDADKPRFAAAFARLAIAQREKHPDAATMSVYFDGLSASEIELVEAAAVRLQAASWFPKLGDWRRAVADEERDRRLAQAAFLRNLPTPLCAACGDTGWVLVEDRAHRCACQEVRRLERLGRLQWPMLPEITREVTGDPQPLTQAEATGALARFNATGLVRQMPDVRPSRVRTIERGRALRITAQGILEQVERCEAVERAADQADTMCYTCAHDDTPTHAHVASVQRPPGPGRLRPVAADQEPRRHSVRGAGETSDLAVRGASRHRAVVETAGLSDGDDQTTTKGPR